MNYQKEIPPHIKGLLIKHNVEYSNVDYYAWPQVFPSTSGPRDGCGGQSMSTFTVEVYVCDMYGPTLYVCCGMYCFEDESFKPFKVINNWKEI